MSPIATDTHDFASLRNYGCIYVDKAMYMHHLFTTKGFFASRACRFRKSLVISVFKVLFKGLAIDKVDWPGIKYLLAHFEFNDLSVTGTKTFERTLADHVKREREDVDLIRLSV